MTGSISSLLPCNVEEKTKAMAPILEQTKLKPEDLKKILKSINSKANTITSALKERKSYEYRKDQTGLACTIRGMDSLPVIIELKRHHGLKESQDGGVAEGGLFRVTTAIDLSRETLIAVKTLNGHLSTESGEDFKICLEHWIKLDPHPNITPCYGYTTFKSQNSSDTKLSIYMEYVDGVDIWEYRGDEAFHSQNFQKIVTGIIEGIAYLHNKGYVHMDLKTENILVESATNNPKICDCDLLLQSGRSYKYLNGVGTDEFIDFSPSRQRHEYSKALYSDDIWTLGIVLVEFFTCKPPQFCNTVSFFKRSYSSVTTYIKSIRRGGPIGEIVASALEPLGKRATIMEIQEKWKNIPAEWSYEGLSSALWRALKLNC